MTKPLHHILLRPLLTEKSVRGAQPSKAQSQRKYIFAVALDATKIEIAQAVEEYFAKEHTKVATVNTLHVRGKQRRMTLERGRRASTGTSPAWKKAIVTLAPDSPSIPLLEGA